jgi:hypothetical protein
LESIKRNSLEYIWRKLILAPYFSIFMFMASSLSISAEQLVYFQNDMYEITDWYASYLFSSQLYRSWCENTKGVRWSKLHDDILYAILYLLPKDMNSQKKKNPKIFRELIQKNEFGVMTNRPQLCKELDRERKRNCCDLSTINRVVERLIQANILLRKVNFDVLGNEDPKGRGNFLIIVNPKMVKNTKKFTQLLESCNQSNNYKNKVINKDNTVDMASTEVDDFYDPSTEIEGEASSDEDGTGKHIESINANSSKQGNFRTEYLKKMKSLNLSRPDAEFYSERILNISKNVFWRGENFSNQVESDCLEYIETIFVATIDKYSSLNSAKIQKFKNSDHFKSHKNQEWSLKGFKSKLANPVKKAFSILERAIYIHKAYLEKNNKNCYYPTAFFSESWGFQRVIDFAITEDSNSFKFSSGSKSKKEHLKIRQFISKASFAVCMSANEVGFDRAWKNFAKFKNELRKLLENSSLKNNQKRNYYENFSEIIVNALKQR